MKTYIKRMRGRESSPPRKPFSKIVWSWLGAFLGIYIIAIFNTLMGADMVKNFFLVGSFGASAVLLYGAPQLDFSQPRNLLGGHLLSALIGITVYRYFPFELPVLSALAVSMAIVAMHLTRTMHPPGGATALIAVIGGPQVYEMSYMLVISPVLLGACLMLIIAVVVNNLSSNPKRHYPRYWF
ncbi:HPP family protein [Campylobacterota bacterium]